MDKEIKEIKQKNALVKNSVFPATDLIIGISMSFSPIVAASLYLVKNLYGLYLDSSMNDVEAFIKEVDNKITLSKEEILADPNFNRGLLIQIEEIIRERSKKKQEILRKVFIKGFMESKDKENFELEKINYTLRLMSIDDIKCLTLFADGNSRRVDSRLYGGFTFSGKPEIEKLQEYKALSGLGLIFERQLDEKESRSSFSTSGRVSIGIGDVEFVLSNFGKKVVKYLTR